MAFFEHHSRSIVKTLTYRALIVITNGAVVYYYTHSFELTTSVMGVSSVINTLIYFFHERAWNHVHWGKRIKK